MNCGIEVLKRLNELIEEDISGVIENCEGCLTEDGLNFYDLVCCLNEKVSCWGVKSIRLLKCTPYIAYFGMGKQGHYVLVEENDPELIVFDSIKGRRKGSKFWFYLFWSKKAIVLEKTMRNML